MHLVLEKHQALVYPLCFKVQFGLFIYLFIYFFHFWLELEPQPTM